MIKKIFITLSCIVLIMSGTVSAVPDFFSDSNIQFYDPNACLPEQPESSGSSDSSAPSGSGKWTIQPGIPTNITEDFGAFMDEVAKYTSYEPIITTSTNGTHSAGSDHYSGNAGDFGSVGNKFGTNNAQPGIKNERGDELAAAGLIAAGMSSGKAKKKALQGVVAGSDNINTKINGSKYRVQVIWKSSDHYDHVHIGIKKISSAYKKNEMKRGFLDKIAKSLGLLTPASAVEGEHDQGSEGSIYMIGDSITERAKSDLNSQLSEKGFNVLKIDSDVGRALDTDTEPNGDSSPPGIQTIKDDQDIIKEADAIVVALGTNSSRTDIAKIPALIKEVKRAKVGIKIYWVNVFSGTNKENSNKRISNYALSLGYNVIDTTNKNIPLDIDGIHETIGEGTKKFSEIVVTGVESGGVGQSDSSDVASDNVCCNQNQSSVSSLEGGSNAGKVWNYFINKGMSAEQAAGIMGNFKVESNFSTTVMYGGRQSKDPSSVNVAWGLAQWLPGSKILVVQDKAGVEGEITDLLVQLDIVWWEMNNVSPTGYTKFYEDYKKINDIAELSLFWQKNYEGSLGQANQERIDAAKLLYSRYKDNAPTSSPTELSSSPQCCVDGGSTNADVDKFLKVLAFQESGGDPTQPGSAGGARGKYQYIDSTWQSSASTYFPPAKTYSTANLAPESVQDAVAYIEYTKKFKDLNNDIFKLAISHFYPVANSDPSKLDVIPPQNVITPRQYANSIINKIKNGGEWEKITLHYQDAPEFNKYSTTNSSNGNDAQSTCGSSKDASTTTSGLAWPVDKKYWENNKDWFLKPHHDYPASDIPIPSGTKVYSISSGTVTTTTRDNGCGVGVFIKTDEGVEYGYCHGTPGTVKVSGGQKVRAGQQIMLSDNTGSSTGPHLHIQVKVSGELRCPQDIFRAVGENKEVKYNELANNGCIN